jgi:hypothetical protein
MRLVELTDDDQVALVLGGSASAVYSTGPREPWSPSADQCIDCGTTELPHRVHGRCTRCDDRWRYAQPSRRICSRS